MNPDKKSPEADRPVPPAVAAAVLQAAIQPSSPRLFFSNAAAANPSAASHRRIAIPVDLSDESAFAVKWAVKNYLRPGDAVILLHVQPTSVLYGADWGSVDISFSEAVAAGQDAGSEELQRKREGGFEAFTAAKAQNLAQPLVQARIPFKIHIVNDHDVKERLCLEVERLGISAVLMGCRGFGASRRSNTGRLESVSDYCAHHCACPVMVVQYPDEGASSLAHSGTPSGTANMAAELPRAGEKDEFRDESNKHKDG